MKDEEIVALYWQRNEQAIVSSEEKYGPLCRSVSYNILQSHEDAQECTNDTWYKAWDTMPPQRPRSLRAYLCRIVRNLSIDRWRKRTSQKRGGGLESLLEELEDCLPPAPSAEEIVEKRSVVESIEAWLRQQKEGDRVIFLRRYWLGVSVEELARWDGCTGPRMSQKLLRLRRSLRKYLEKEGVAV